MNCAKIIRAKNPLQYIHQVTIEFRFRKPLAQERFKIINGRFYLPIDNEISFLGMTLLKFRHYIRYFVMDVKT